MTIPTPAELGFDPDALREKYRFERDKRLQPEGNAQYQEVGGEFSHYVDDPYVSERIARAPFADEVDVLIVGGGFGGLICGARLREAGVQRIRIIERLKENQTGPVLLLNHVLQSIPTDAAIWLTNLEQKGGAGRVQSFNGYPDFHPTRIGEFNPVAHQVREDLPETEGIADEPLGNVIAHQATEVQSLVFRSFSKQNSRFFHASHYSRFFSFNCGLCC